MVCVPAGLTEDQDPEVRVEVPLGHLDEGDPLTVGIRASDVILARERLPSTSARNQLPGVVTDCPALVGGIFVILAVAMGLTNYLVDAEVPQQAAAWIGAEVESRLMFLLLLNLFLLAVGCMMDIYSAIVVVVPLILPLSVAFGIHPLHLGVIFLANLELGYLTPPVGMNLYLAAFRFDKPLAEVIVSVLPILGVMLVFVLAITYLPLVVAFPGF